MNSGIYKYTFANGATYIGQAVDIEKRWCQHTTKMQKGQHTKLVQAAYNRYGLPEFSIILRCHPHYLDAFESLYIFTNSPELNGNQPAHYLTQSLKIEFSQDIISRNIYENIIELEQLREQEKEQEELIVELEQQKRRLEKRLISIAKESQPKELRDYIGDLEADVHSLATELKAQEHQFQERLDNYNKLPWYKRIFRKV